MDASFHPQCHWRRKQPQEHSCDVAAMPPGNTLVKPRANQAWAGSPKPKTDTKTDAFCFRPQKRDRKSGDTRGLVPLCYSSTRNGSHRSDQEKLRETEWFKYPPRFPCHIPAKFCSHSQVIAPSAVSMAMAARGGSHRFTDVPACWTVLLPGYSPGFGMMT